MPLLKINNLLIRKIPIANQDEKKSFIIMWYIIANYYIRLDANTAEIILKALLAASRRPRRGFWQRLFTGSDPFVYLGHSTNNRIDIGDKQYYLGTISEDEFSDYENAVFKTESETFKTLVSHPLHKECLISVKMIVGENFVEINNKPDHCRLMLQRFNTHL